MSKGHEKRTSADQHTGRTPLSLPAWCLALVGIAATLSLAACVGENAWTGTESRGNTDGSPTGEVGCEGPGCDDPSTGESGFGDRECALLSARGEIVTSPVDIVWVIDGSESMEEEAAIVQGNINDFAAEIASSGIDYRVVVITDLGFVTVPPPLGTDEARFLFVDQHIGSIDGLQRLLDQFDRFGSFLRDEALTHFVMVTDDDSALSASQFRTQMEILLRGSFTFHAIASEQTAGGDCIDPYYDRPVPCGCSGPNGEATSAALEHYGLADQTGGEQLSICSGDWMGLFGVLESAVVRSASIPCSYDLPAPPEDMIFDPALVDVAYTDNTGTRTSLARAVDPSRCGSELAWHFDNESAPSRIDFCPEACSTLGADGEGLVEIALGCAPNVILY